MEEKNTKFIYQMILPRHLVSFSNGFIEDPSDHSSKSTANNRSWLVSSFTDSLRKSTMRISDYTMKSLARESIKFGRLPKQLQYYTCMRICMPSPLSQLRNFVARSFVRSIIRGPKPEVD